jgi:hypothetical protein
MVARMVRKQVYLEARQDAWLKRRAAELGVTEAELIRRGLDRLGRAPEAWPPDPGAWAEARAEIVRRLEMTAPQTGRAWTRDELYEDRLGRTPPADA